jgi:hypothetical protein
MPIKKYSAMDPSGTFRSDAMDQVEQWNSARGDQWNQFNTNIQNQRQQDDWRKDVALQQLGLNREMYQGGREDSAAERAAKYGFMGQELGLRKEESAAERALRERGFGLQERGLNMQLSEQERLAQERADEAAALDAMDFSQLGAGAGYAKAAPRGLKAQIAAQMLTRGMEKSMRPEDRATMGEDVRGQMALQNMSKLEQQGVVTPREAQMYAQAQAEATKQGYGGTGGMAPQQAKAQEFAKQEARQIIAKADELAGGMLGYASGKDVQEILDRTNDLADLMQRAGYPPDQINSVMQEIQMRLEQVNANDFKTAQR